MISRTLFRCPDFSFVSLSWGGTGAGEWEELRDLASTINKSVLKRLRVTLLEPNSYYHVNGKLSLREVYPQGASHWDSFFLSLGSPRGNPIDRMPRPHVKLAAWFQLASVPCFRKKKKKKKEGKHFLVSLLGEFSIELFKERVNTDLVFKMANSTSIWKSENNSDKKSNSACEQTRWLHTPSSSLLVFSSPLWKFLPRKTHGHETFWLS